MANPPTKRISALDVLSAGEVVDADYMPMVDASVPATKRITFATLKSIAATGLSEEISAAVTSAQSAAANAVASSNVARFATKAALLADNNSLIGYTGSGATIIVSAGAYVEVVDGQFAYKVLASDASTYDEITAGGVRLEDTNGQGASKYDISVPMFQLGAIRNNGDQSDEFNWWKLISDGTHKPLGFRNASGSGMEIETTDSIIRIHHNIGGDYVGALIASVDETLAQTGLRLGCSVGITYSDIWLYRDFMAQISRNAAGVWNHDPNNAEPFTAAWNASGYLDVTFPDTPSAIGIVQQIGSTELGIWSGQFQQTSSTSARIHFYRRQRKKHVGRIRWNSGFSLVGTPVNLTIGTFSGGLLPVSFTDGAVNDTDIRVTTGGGINGIGHHAQIRNPGPTGCDIQWVDASGAQVTTADNKMEAIVSAVSSTNIAEQPSNSTTFALRVMSRSSINPKSITATDYPSGNIWLVGGVTRDRD